MQHPWVDAVDARRVKCYESGVGGSLEEKLTSIPKIFVAHESEIPIAFRLIDGFKNRAESQGTTLAKLPRNEEEEIVAAMPVDYELGGGDAVRGWPPGIPRSEVIDCAFGFMHLMGFELHLFLSPGSTFKLYSMPGQKLPPKAQKCFGGVVKKKHFEEHWDEMCRIAASVLTYRLPASKAFERLPVEFPHLFKGYRELGRAIGSVFYMRYIRDKEFRDRRLVPHWPLWRDKEGNYVGPRPERRGQVDWGDPRWVSFMARRQVFEERWGSVFKQVQAAQVSGGESAARRVAHTLPEHEREEMLREHEALQLQIMSLVAEALQTGDLKETDFAPSPFLKEIIGAVNRIRRQVFGEPGLDGSGPELLDLPPTDRYGNPLVPSSDEFPKLREKVGTWLDNAVFFAGIIEEAARLRGSLHPVVCGRIRSGWSQNNQSLLAYCRLLDAWRGDPAVEGRGEELRAFEAAVHRGRELAARVLAFVEKVEERHA
ncbi:MAG: Tn3 family transposase [Nitrospirae bacterium]|nr:Tn3 family transposase [Nitrospirota bacterium]